MTASNTSICFQVGGVDKVELQAKQDDSKAFPGSINGSMDQQHRTTFYALEDARSSYKRAMFMDSRVFGRFFSGSY